MKIELNGPPDDISEISKTSESRKKIYFSYQGFVSRVREGVGRSDNDRQYVFCNSRPVDMPSIPKLFNEA